MDSSGKAAGNIDSHTVASFGDEWERFDQSRMPEDEAQRYFHAYFHLFPWHRLPEGAEGFDMGCGSGRWAKYAAPRVGTLHCIEPARQALQVAQRNLKTQANVRFHHASVDTAPLAEASQDFGYSLGVLHHIPDTEAAMRRCVQLLKPGAPFLLYLYYRFDNRPWWFRLIWKMSELIRGPLSRAPDAVKHGVTDSLALLIYWPLARLCRHVEHKPWARHIPLYAYRHASFYTMRTDSRDRFGTPLEQRFTRHEIEAMMRRSGLTEVVFSDKEPYWCAMGIRA